MKPITKKELIDLINKIKGVTFVSVDVQTEPKMRKTDNPYLGTTKLVTLSGAINYDYENSVNNQLLREGKEANFIVSPRKWGEHANNWIEYKNDYYLSIKVENYSEPVFIYNGNKIDKELLEPFLQKSKDPKTQENLEKKVILS